MRPVPPFIVHVNRGTVDQNRKHGTDRPTIRIARGRAPRFVVYAHEVEILGPSRFVTAERPLKCGARVWIEAACNVRIIRRRPDGTTYSKELTHGR